MYNERMKITNRKLQGFYGYYKSVPRFIYQAIAIGRMIEFRGLRTPNGLGDLLDKVREWPVGDYKRRQELLVYFGIRSYQQYLDCELWKAVRALAMTMHGGGCRFCGHPASQVHHGSYDIATLSGAVVDKLYPTCSSCHRLIEFDENDRKRTFGEVVSKTSELAFF